MSKSIGRERLTELAVKAAIESTHRYNYMPHHGDQFYPHEWVIEAMQLAVAEALAQPSDGALTNEGAEPVAQYTYASKQETNCAGCSLRKHTPLRIDDMGGYVCLTCIDKQLDAFFASPAQASVILPPAPELPEEPLFADDDSHMDAYHAACRMRNACAKAIAAAGVGLRLEP